MPEYKIGDNIVFDCGERPVIGTVHSDSFTERYPYLMVDDGTWRSRIAPTRVYDPDTIDEIEKDAYKTTLERYIEYCIVLDTEPADSQDIEVCMANIEKAIAAYRDAAVWLKTVVEAARLLKEI